MKKTLHALLLLGFAFTLTFCTNKSKTSISAEQSHGSSVKPNYSIVFPNDKVNRVDIKIDKKQWNIMLTDLKSNIGESDRIPPGGPRNISDRETTANRQDVAENEHPQRIHEGPPPGGLGMRPEMENDGIHPQGRNPKMGPPPGGMPGEMPGGEKFEPVWAYCDILFDNEKWDKVGIHFKGNSSLRTAYQSGINKLSFKLDFDKFETEFHEIENQRFYGFKQLNLKNNFDDKSFMREKVASDLFADFGLVSPKTSFYRVFVDYGDGPLYFGLYTLVEEVDDTVIETSFSSGNGNLYKPEGIAATFADGSFRTTDMNKKNNKKSNDFADVQQLSTLLNSSIRVENPELWKSQLSEIFDVQVFLKWLAANTVMQNWDTYGNSVHNFYLYNNPTSSKLVWIPWDNNEAFQHGKMGGSLSLSMNDVGENWPIIRYILDVEDWQAEYKKNVSEFTNHIFTPEKMSKIYSNYQQIIVDYAIGEQGEKANYTFLRNESDFTKAIEFLKQHVIDRNKAVQEFLSK